MIILIGSNNPSKKRALAIALMKLNFCNYEIFSYDVHLVSVANQLDMK